jgi:hypothetical protein
LSAKRYARAPPRALTRANVAGVLPPNTLASLSCVGALKWNFSKRSKRTSSSDLSPPTAFCNSAPTAASATTSAEGGAGGTGVASAAIDKGRAATRAQARVLRRRGRVIGASKEYL